MSREEKKAPSSTGGSGSPREVAPIPSDAHRFHQLHQLQSTNLRALVTQLQSRMTQLENQWIRAEARAVYLDLSGRLKIQQLKQHLEKTKEQLSQTQCLLTLKEESVQAQENLIKIQARAIGLLEQNVKTLTRQSLRSQGHLRQIEKTAERQIALMHQDGENNQRVHTLYVAENKQLAAENLQLRAALALQTQITRLEKTSPSSLSWAFHALSSYLGCPTRTAAQHQKHYAALAGVRLQFSQHAHDTTREATTLPQTPILTGRR